MDINTFIYGVKFLHPNFLQLSPNFFIFTPTIPLVSPLITGYQPQKSFKLKMPLCLYSYVLEH